MQENERIALERLLDHADGLSGQSCYVADFLLAWWNAEECGGFDLTKLWALDTAIAADVVTVTGLISRVHQYPDTLGYGPRFNQLIRAWRAPAIA
ncbi:MAG: hypothetical protein JSS87_11235 [Acidobacteria bacterium]|jgi:hypothetical protein|uniref:DUF7673 family protein n=1 Tax=Edaphobacter flagellatus TaxID=1933044 RepID=UPI001D608D5A|nr:hypothetical protein [Edaphobacter flagellatus]MBS1815440.1 hypothetical protein [Acidobacteriota bacterium]